MKPIRKAMIGDILTLERTKITPDPDALFNHIGVKSFGKGVIEYGPTLGAELSKLSYYRIPARALLLSNIKAWEQAVAVTSDRHVDFIASQRFLPYVPKDSEEVDVDYLYEYFLSDAGEKQLQKASPGSVDRNRTLGIVAFEKLVIPLPSGEEQRRISSRLALLRTSLERASGPLDSALAVMDRIEEEIVFGSMKGAVSLGELCEINPSPKRVSPEVSVVFAPMASLSVEEGSLVGAEIRKRSDVGAGYKQFSRGDLVFARITPSMQNGKSAIFDHADHEVGYGTTEFHVLKPREPYLAPAIHALLRSTWFKSLAMASFTGTAGQQRVPASFLQQVHVPNLRDSETRKIIQGLKSIEEVRWRLRALAKKRIQLASALPKAMRNDIFSTMV